MLHVDLHVGLLKGTTIKHFIEQNALCPLEARRIQQFEVSYRKTTLSEIPQYCILRRIIIYNTPSKMSLVVNKHFITNVCQQL